MTHRDSAFVLIAIVVGFAVIAGLWFGGFMLAKALLSP
jgi:multisubunit Na+/H+ antiporter MnhC subunit